MTLSFHTFVLELVLGLHILPVQFGPGVDYFYF